MKHLGLIIVLTLFVNVVLGQKADLIDKSNSDLIDNDLLSVAIDKDGNKWIGTSKFGLVKYENNSFKSLNKENSKINGDYISPIFTDSKGNVWVAFSNPEDGLAKFDGEKWTTYSAKDIGIKNLSVITVTEDNNGKIYFGGSGGVFVYSDNWSILDLPKGNYTIRTIDTYKNGSIAIGHNSGLLVSKNDKWNSYNEENSELRLGTIRAVKFLDDGSLVVGYGGGFGDGGFSIVKNDKWKHYNKTNSKVPDHMVRDIEIDQNGVIWMATNNGVIKMDGKKITPILFREGMYKNVILDIALENDTIWIATNFGLIKMK